MKPSHSPTPSPPAPDPRAGPVLQALRAATQSRHAAIESVLQLQASRDLRRFGAALQVFEAFLRGWEPLAAQAMPLGVRPWFEAHRRGHLATRDLRVLGLPALEAHGLPQLPLASAAEALGSAYVIEGSALGGTLIARFMAERFGIDAGGGASFFAARGAGTARTWREFCAHLEAELAADGGAIGRACEAACLTFDALALALRRHLPLQAAGKVK